MHPLAVRVLRAMRAQSLVPADGTVVVAVSGGSDSVALAHLLAELDAAGDLTLVALAHFNHQIRGAEAEADEAFCGELAGRLSRPIDVERADVRARARAEKRSLEDAARAARYEFLERARGRAAAGGIAVGHTRDDQAETFLLRLVRGAGPRGLAGIYPRHGAVIRPLLDLRRTALREYLKEIDEPFREDASNRDVAIPRNRVRVELLPYIERHFNVGIVNVLAREARIARDDAEWLDAAAAEASASILTAGDGRLIVDALQLCALPAALRHRVARLALRSGAGERFVSFDHAAALLELAAGDVRGPLNLPGLRATRDGTRLVLVPGGRGMGSEVAPAASKVLEDRGCWSLSVPGRVEIEPLGVEISAEFQAVPPADPLSASVVAVAADRVAAGQLAIRTRQPGDRLKPLGLGGHKKVQDLLVDRKVPRAERDRVPIVVDGLDRIVWVAGQALSDDFRVVPGSSAVIILKVRRLAGGRGGSV